MAAIDIGPGATDRGGWADTSGYTNILKDNPANATGKLTTVKFFFQTAASGVKVGAFYLTGTDQLKCRDATTIGSVTAGSAQSFAVDLDVHEGDFIGWYCASGAIQVQTTIGGGMYYKSGDYVDAGVEASFNGSSSIKAESVEGAGETPETPEIICSTQAATDITSTTATLNGAATGLTESAYAVSRGFEWDIDSGAPYANDWHENGTWDEDMSWDHDLTGLTPGTPVYYRAYIVTSTE